VRATARGTLVALMLLSFTACTTMQTIEDFSPTVLEQRIEVDDRVHIVARSGKDYYLTVTRVDSAMLEGHTDAGKRYKIPFEAILHVEIAEADVVTSAFATLVTVYVVASAVFLYAILSWASEDD
jgi:hypothetical protein